MVILLNNSRSPADRAHRRREKAQAFRQGCHAAPQFPNRPETCQASRRNLLLVFAGQPYLPARMPE